MEVIRNPNFLKTFLKEGIYKVSPPTVRYPLVVLFENAPALVLPESQEDFLEKILQAVNLRLDEAKLINRLSPNPEDNWEDWQEIPSQYLIAFGTKIPVFKVDIPLYEVKYYKTLSFFVADSLADIAEDKDKKKQLWKVLQEMLLKN